MKGAVRETLFKGLNSIRCDLEFTAHLRKLLSAECVTEETDDLLLFLACFIRQFSWEIMKFVFRPEALSCNGRVKRISVIMTKRFSIWLLGLLFFKLKRNVFNRKIAKPFFKVVKLIQMFIKNNETATAQYVVKHSGLIKLIVVD